MSSGLTEPRLPHDFPPDRFQLEAFEGLDSGESVLVAAPTGSGKTVVAEYAILLALRAGRKVFYTSPIKALSNQKFHDLVGWLGRDAVGLLTGDNSINGDAPVVVMTTEVLRNMLYAGANALDGLAFVVLDEVHYLQDAYRGPVWEEVMIHLPADVRLVCLSATVSNAEELAGWISTVRGPTRTVVEHRRPVRLVDLYMVGDRNAERDHLLPVLVDGRPNPEGFRFDVDPRPSHRYRTPARRFRPPRRVDVIERLRDENLLPAIYFIFSRMGCDDAATHCLDAGLRLSTPHERARITEILEERVAPLSDADLDVLGYDRFAEALTHGIASHHAGLVPAFKEAVERCFAEGLVKVVFATETLALGINMPARTVLIERLTKFNGEGHEFLRPSQYTQLTGRAGRRGIDERGTAIVAWSPFATFDQVASLAASTEYTLTSAFRPTYNMAANLVRRYDPDTAHHLLDLSFAQYQADRSVVGVTRRLERARHEMDEIDADLAAVGDSVSSYAALVAEVEALRRRMPDQRHAIELAVSLLSPGEVVDLGSPEAPMRAVVISVAQRGRKRIRVRVVDADGEALTLGYEDFAAAPEVVGEAELPVPYEPRDSEFQAAAAEALRRLNPRRPGPRRGGGEDPTAAELAKATARLEAHPFHRYERRDELLAAQSRQASLGREATELERRVRHSSETLAARFDRVLDLLGRWGQLDGWSLTPSGERLAGIYHECDLLISTAIDDGLLSDLDAAGMAAMASCFVYEHRSPAPPPPPDFPSTDLRRRYAEIEEIWVRLTADERSRGLAETRAPDPGFVHLAAAWASGSELEGLLSESDLTGGDFVRTVKQLIDLLRQLGDVLPDVIAAAVARRAAESLFRGVVAASSEIVLPGDPGDADGPADAAASAEPPGGAG